MKKGIVALIFSILLVTLFLTGCNEETTEIISSEKVQEMEGSYFLFKTTDVQKYFNFLEEFDETKYEIVDISTSMLASYSNEFYMVTYKVKEFEK